MFNPGPDGIDVPGGDGQHDRRGQIPEGPDPLTLAKIVGPNYHLNADLFFDEFRKFFQIVILTGGYSLDHTVRKVNDIEIYFLFGS